MVAKSKAKSAVFEPPGLEVATALRPDAIARLECVRITWQTHPQWDTGLVIKAAIALEKYVSSGQAPEQSGSDG